MLLSGIEFNEKYKNINFYKLTNKSEIHNNFQFKDGINKDTIGFNPHGSCEPGGIYFTEESKIGMWTDYSDEEMIFIRKVTIPEYANVYIEDDKFKVDIIILGTKILIEDYIETHDNISQFIIQNPDNIRYIKKQTEELCKLAVSRDGCVLEYVQKQTEEICKLAVSQNGYAVRYVKNQTEELCKLAVSQKGHTLQYVQNQTEELCKLAVSQDGLALECVQKQTEEICKLAVSQNGRALEYVEIQTEELCKLAVSQDGLALEYVQNERRLPARLIPDFWWERR